MADDLIQDLLPHFLGMISNSIKAERTVFKQKLFERLLRQHPVLADLWEKILSQLLKILLNETENNSIDTEKMDGKNSILMNDCIYARLHPLAPVCNLCSKNAGTPSKRYEFFSLVVH